MYEDVTLDHIAAEMLPWLKVNAKALPFTAKRQWKWHSGEARPSYRSLCIALDAFFQKDGMVDRPPWVLCVKWAGELSCCKPYSKRKDAK